MKHAPLVASMCLLGATCASGAYWGLQLSRPQPRAAAAAARPDPPPAIGAAAGLFGGAPAGPAATAFQLKGVIADGPDGVAILAADGKPALAVGVGTEAAPGVTVTEVHQRYVLLSEGGAVKRLDLPDAGIHGVELVAAAAPARPVAPPRVAVATSGGAMPRPVVDPAIAGTPGMTPDQAQQMQQMQQMRQVEQMQRARRPAGIGPAAFGARPAT